jgi:hypothetical protein
VVALGLLILIAVTAVGVVMVLRGEDSVRIDVEPLGTYRTDASVVFIVGVLTVLVGVLGVAILLAGLKRARRQRAELRALKDRARQAETGTASHQPSGRRSEPYDDTSSDGDDHFDSTPRDR